ncbi:MAG: glycosyltransferase family 4 protein [Taibaiella sp.]|nr:glycosyltransferase family 4 protein [Taibaiella sp.]
MKVVSVISAFPENSIVIGRFEHLVKSDTIDYHVYCWESKPESWEFWTKNITKQEKKKVIISGISNVRSLKIFSELLGVIWFLLNNPKISQKHYSQFKNKPFRKYLSALLDDYKLMRLKPDILHFEFGTMAVTKSYLAKIISCKVVTSFRGYDINYYRLGNDKIYEAVWNNTDAFHFLGKDLYNRALLRGYRGDKKNFFIPPAINVMHFKNRDAKIAIIGKAINIISVSRLVWKKGVEFGLLAFKYFIDKGGEGVYHIVGDGPSAESIKFTIYELGLQDKVILHGKLKPEETKELLQKSDVFLHPAISEGFCNSVIEAQAMELPVICSDADGLLENIEDGETGYGVKKWDYNAMGKKLFYLFNNPEERIRMGKNGRERVINKYRIEDQTNKFIELYNSLVPYDEN